MAKAPRNKTIDIPLEDGGEYLARTLSPAAPVSIEQAENRTLLGDCFSLLPLLPESSFDMLICDPPYNLTKQYDGRRFTAMDRDDYLSFTRRWLELTIPLLKPDASVYVCCDWRSSGVIEQALSSSLRIRNRITWQREKGRGAKKNWKNAMEDIWFATVSDDYYFDLEAVKQRRRVIAPYRAEGSPKDWEETEEGKFRNTCPSNFWDDITVPYWSMPENTPHPTQKPEKLLAKLILASSREGGLILDPFAGSGSTAVAAKKLGRRFVSIEQSAQYCVWAERRLELAESDRGIQGFSGGVFWERNSRPKI